MVDGLKRRGVGLEVELKVHPDVVDHDVDASEFVLDIGKQLGALVAVDHVQLVRPALAPLRLDHVDGGLGAFQVPGGGHHRGAVPGQSDAGGPAVAETLTRRLPPADDHGYPSGQIVFHDVPPPSHVRGPATSRDHNFTPVQRLVLGSFSLRETRHRWFRCRTLSVRSSYRFGDIVCSSVVE